MPLSYTNPLIRRIRRLHVQRIPRDLARKYAFDSRDEPLLKVRPGESFRNRNRACTLATRAAANVGRRQGHSGEMPGADLAVRWRWRQPDRRGRFSPEGPARGDVLVISIEDILAEDYSWIAIGPRANSSRAILDTLASNSVDNIDRNLPPHRKARGRLRPRRRHAAFQRQDFVAHHSIYRHAGSCPRSRERIDRVPRRSGRMGITWTFAMQRSRKISILLLDPPSGGTLFYLGDVHAGIVGTLNLPARPP